MIISVSCVESKYWRFADRFITFYIYLHFVTMPITIDEFESQPGSLLSLDRNTQAYRVLEFLYVNSDSAFTSKEIREETGLKKGSIGVVLSRLEDQGLVRHKGKYWAVIEDDRLASITAMTEGSSASVDDDYFGEE